MDLTNVFHAHTIRSQQQKLKMKHTAAKLPHAVFSMNTNNGGISWESGFLLHN